MKGSLFLLVRLEKAGELFLEARQAATAVDELLLAAGPCGVRLRVNVEMQNVTLFAPGGAGGEFAAVCHHHFDGMVTRMDILFHRQFPGARQARQMGDEFGGSIQQPVTGGKPLRLTAVGLAGH